VNVIEDLFGNFKSNADRTKCCRGPSVETLTQPVRSKLILAFIS